MKSYRSPLNNSDDIFSVSFPYRFRINPVSFPYRFRIVLLSSSYHPPIAKRKTIRNEAENNTEWNEKRTNEVRWNKGGQFYHYLSFGFRQGGLKALLWVRLDLGEQPFSLAILQLRACLCGAHFSCEASLLSLRENLRLNIQLGHACPIKTAIRLSPISLLTGRVFKIHNIFLHGFDKK